MIASVPTMLDAARNRSSLVRLLAAVRSRCRTAVAGSVLVRSVRGRGASVARTAAARTRRGAATARVVRPGTALRRYVAASRCYRWLTTDPEPSVVVLDLRETRTVGPFVGPLERTIRAVCAAGSRSTVVAGVHAASSFGRRRPIRLLSSLVLLGTGGSLLWFGATAPLSAPLLAAHLVTVVLAAAGLRSTHTLADLLESRLGRRLREAFEPPTPPNGRADDRDVDDRLDETERSSGRQP